MAKNRFNIKGTKDFLVAAVFCGFLCIWSIRDAWFPTEKVMQKHPREIMVAFQVSGVIKEINIKPGDEIVGKTVLASLYDDTYRAKVAEAEAVFETAKKDKAPDVDDKLELLVKARENLDACAVENTDITWKSTHGEEALRGIITRILADVGTHVDVGTPVLAVKPNDSFYAFNKTLAVLSFIGMIAALVFHRIASH